MRYLLLLITLFGCCACVDFNPIKYKAKIEDYAKYRNAFDEGKSHAGVLSSSYGKMEVMGRTKYTELEKDVYRYPVDELFSSYKEKLDTLLSHADYRSEPVRAYMLRYVVASYNRQQIEWGDFRKVARGIYEITDQLTQSTYVVARYRAQEKEAPSDLLSLEEWGDESVGLKEKIKNIWDYYVYYRWGYHIIFYRKETTNNTENSNE